MKQLSLLLFFAFMLCNSASFAGRLPIDHIVLELNKINTEGLAIVIWDQREMVVDHSQPETFLGYVRSITGIAYGHITKSQVSLTKILGSKIQSALKTKGTTVGIIEVSPYEMESDLVEKIKKSDYSKVLVLRLNNFIFDGVTKVEYVADIETIVYDTNGAILYTDNVSSKTPLGSSGKIKKTVPENMKAILEKTLTRPVLIESIENSQSIPAETVIEAYDKLITKEGDELDVKVIEITETSVKYKLAEQMDGPLRNIALDNVFMIKYSDGTKEVFK